MAKIRELALKVGYFVQYGDGVKVQAKFVLRAVENRIRPALAFYRCGDAVAAYKLLKQFTYSEQERSISYLGWQFLENFGYAKTDEERAGLVDKLQDHTDAIVKAANAVLADEPGAKDEFVAAQDRINRYLRVLQDEACEIDAQRTLDFFTQSMKFFTEQGMEKGEAFDITSRAIVGGILRG